MFSCSCILGKNITPKHYNTISPRNSAILSLRVSTRGEAIPWIQIVLSKSRGLLRRSFRLAMTALFEYSNRRTRKGEGGVHVFWKYNTTTLKFARVFQNTPKEQNETKKTNKNKIKTRTCPKSKQITNFTDLFYIWKLLLSMLYTCNISRNTNRPQER